MLLKEGDVGQTMSNACIQNVLGSPIKLYLLLVLPKKLNISSSNNDSDDTPEDHLSPRGFWEELIFMIEKKGGAEFMLMIILAIFTLVTYICQFIPNTSNPSILPNLPYEQLTQGGMILWFSYGIFRRLPQQIAQLERKLLGSLKDTYDEFKDELQERLTKTNS